MDNTDRFNAAGDAAVDAAEVATPRAFAKLYEFPDLGQVLVEQGEDEDGWPALRFRGVPYRGIDVIGEFSAGAEVSDQADLFHEFETMTPMRARMFAGQLRREIDAYHAKAKTKTERIEVEIGFKIPEEDQAILDRVRAAAEDLGFVRDAAKGGDA